MKIACLAWGSIVWEPKDLLIRQPWFNDGPLLPIEFCRQSQDGRITLVITPEKTPIRTLWALFSVDQIDAAIDSLRSREGIPPKNRDKHIGRWANSLTPKDKIENEIAGWAEKKQNAEMYIRKAPKQIDTDYRRKIQTELGWSPQNNYRNCEHVSCI
ncbi:MAG: hypothetical protein MUO43_06495 [Desulfobacterales bacterium]|nr:hypothetical protein [Desulfobacterales bacterium]